MYEAIPDELKQCRNWVCWRYVERGGKKTKIPVNPRTGGAAKSNDPGTWADFSLACRVAETSHFDGVGFMLSRSPYVGIDLDHCITTGPDGAPVFSETARRVLEAAKSYAEISPSGTGVHILIRGDIPSGRRNAEIEVYPAGRFFTMTGRTIQGYGTIRAAQDVLDAITQTIESERGPVETRDAPAKPRPASPVPQGDEELLSRIRNSEQSAKFAALYDRGDISAYGNDHSAADMALMNILAFWTGNDAARMERIFSASALGQRRKWKERRDYRGWTISRAIRGTGKTYQPKQGQRNDPAAIPPELKKKLALMEYTDRGMAERMRTVYASRLRYCAAVKSWYVYDGKRWKKEDEARAYLYLYRLIDATRAAVEDFYKQKLQAGTFSSEDRDKLERVRAYLKKRNNYQNATSILRAARSFFLTEADQFDAAPMLLNTQSGVLDLNTFQLMPHDPARLMARITAAGYRPGYRSALWEQTVNQIIPDEETRRWLQKFIGYCLTGSVEAEKFLFLYGPGGRGKGTFIETIAAAMGDYADTFPIEILLSRRNDATSGNEPTPQLAKMAGVRLAITSEAPAGRRFNDARVKLYTGGDRLTARALNCPPFTFPPCFKIIGQTNYMPEITDAADAGIKRRLIIVPFEAPIKYHDVKLKAKLKQPDVLAAVLSWAVEGCRMWQREGLEPIPDHIRDRLAAYYDEADDVGAFLAECCTLDKNARTPIGDLYDAFLKWYGPAKYPPMTKKSFSQALASRNFARDKDGRGLRYMSGLAIRYL